MASSRWSGQLTVRIAVLAAALGCAAPLAVAGVRVATHQHHARGQVTAAGRAVSSSSPVPASPTATTLPADDSSGAAARSNDSAATTSTTTAHGASPTSTSTSTPSPTSTTAPATLTLVDADNGKSVSLRPGQRLRVILRSTYWQFADPSNTDVLASQGPTVYATGDNCPPLPGTGCGTATATYRAQKPGSSTITATRAACNETLRCTPDDMQFRLDVKVTA